MQAGIPAWVNALLALGGLGTLVSGLGLWWKNRRDARLAEVKDGRDAQRDDVEVFAGWMSAARDSAKEAADARREAAAVRAEMASMRLDIDALLERVATLEDEVRALEAERDAALTDKIHLVGYVTVVIAGIEAGTIPPLPPMPPTVAAILSRISHTRE